MIATSDVITIEGVILDEDTCSTLGIELFEDILWLENSICDITGSGTGCGDA